jgi:transcriptional regulator with XRE-family HTH domain
MARKPPGPKAAGLGAELRAVRKRLGLSMAEVATRLEWSESTVSRLETGHRNIDIEDVSALLAVYGVTGAERDRLMTLARTPDESSWVDTDLPGLPSTSVKLAMYERDAVAITDWSPLLIPGLLQTMEFSRAYMLSDGIPEAEVGARLMARQRRQEILGRVAYTAFIDETVLARQIGSQKIFSRQLRHLIEVIEEGAVTVRITPCKSDGHAGLISPFILLEFELSTPIVHVELARSGVFLTGQNDTAVYPATVSRLDALSLDTEGSLQRLRAAAGAIGSGT